jgi:hypothetical protein
VARTRLPIVVELRAMLLVVAARSLLKMRPTTVVLRMLARRRATLAPGAVEPLRALAAVRRAGRLAGGDCLPQSVALAAMLRRQGAEPVLVLGCRRLGPQEWGAHAWVELNGARLEPLEAPDHTELARLTPAADWEISPAG